MRSTAQRRIPRAPESEARLAFVEFLLSCEAPIRCVEEALLWLERHAGIAESLCALVEDAAPVLTTVASRGLPIDPRHVFRLDLGAEETALAQALERSSPAYFNAARRHPESPLEGRDFHAVPLITASGRKLGLLLIASGPELSPVVAWVAERLGTHLGRLKDGAAHASEQVQRERSLLFGIINAVADPILLTDLDGEPIIANARAKTLFCAREEDSEGRKRAVRLNQLLFGSALQSDRVDAGGPHRRELPLIDPHEGSELLFELLTCPVRTDGERPGVVSVLRNMTDLGRATQALGESYERLRASEQEVRSERHRLDLVIDSVADPIIITEPSGRISMMNAPAAKLFSAPPTAADARQRRVRANDAHFFSFVSNLLLAGDVLRRQMNLVDPVTGGPKPVEAVGGKVLGERGELATVVTIFHDRTEALENARLVEQLKRASTELKAKVQAATAELAAQNERLRRQALELEQASAAKSQFLANMSHEFRTPLNAILGYTNMLLQGVSGELSFPQKRNLTRIDSNGRHLLEVINEILDISRIEAGRMPLNLSDFRLEELLQEVVSELDPIIARSPVRFRAEVPRELPAVHSDRQKVKQVVLNLLSNALKFTHKGTVQLSARYLAANRTFAVAVADTGIGIQLEDQAKIFEDFQQVDSSPTRAYGGTGLGLSICKRLSGMLGGRISVDSEPGRGSTFTLHFPRKARRT